MEEYVTGVRVYCDSGGFRSDLKQLELGGVITLYTFPYENENKKIAGMGLPSEMTWSDMKFPWSYYTASWSDYKGSDQYQLILDIVGKENRKDAMQLDTAYKSRCHYFFTSDKSDICSKREKLEELLGFKIYHPIEDWAEFMKALV